MLRRSPGQAMQLSRRMASSFVALFLTIAFLRAAGFAFGIVNVDECDFHLFARLVQDGARPYVGVVDNKPPLTYAAYALANALGGSHWILAVRVVGVVVVFLTSVALFAAARAWAGDVRRAWAAAWLAVAAGLCESPSVSAELLMNLPVAVALWLLARAGRETAMRARLEAGAGVAACLAALAKQQAAVLIVAVVVGHLWHAWVTTPRRARARELVQLAPFLLGCAAALSVVAAAFASIGALGGSVEWLVSRTFAQVHSGSRFSGGRAAAGVAVCVLAAAPVPWALALWGTRDAPSLFHRILVTLLAMTAVAVSIGGRFYEHYFLQFVPPLALLGAGPLVTLCQRWRERSPGLRRAALALAALPVAGYLAYTLGRGLAGGYPLQDGRVRALASWVKTHSDPSDRMFVWGDLSILYCAAERLPGTRYLRASFHVGDLDPEHADPARLAWHPSQRDVTATLADLAANRPALVLDTATGDLHHWALFPMREVPALDEYVREHYRLVARPSDVAVYRRP
ncbi:MAG: hypothetical protein ACJ79R_19780 [Anaeromyxobacteraceae bacterium]